MPFSITNVLSKSNYVEKITKQIKVTHMIKTITAMVKLDYIQI